jgi:hypothetical protein
MATVTVIGDEVRTVEGRVSGDRLLVDRDRLPDALGWKLEPQGLCRDDTCVPVRDQAALFVDGQLDLAAVAAALGRPAVVDAAAGLAALALPAEARRQALDGLRAPAFELADLDGTAHRLEEWHGVRKLLVAFASW